MHPQPNDREGLLIFLAALDASPVGLRRDLHRDEGRRGNYGIHGKWGHIYIDGKGFLLCVTAKDERDQSPRRWTSIKRRLAFCRITQDGDDEGCLHLRSPAIGHPAAAHETSSSATYPYTPRASDAVRLKDRRLPNRAR